jgi:hypothetical protein
VVVHGHRERLLRALLADHVLIENLLDFGRLGELVARTLGAVFELLTDDVIAELDALVANENRRTGDQLANFMLTLAAERAVQQLAVVVPSASVLGHRCSACRSAGTSPDCNGFLYITALRRNPRARRAEAVVSTGFVENCESLRTGMRPCAAMPELSGRRPGRRRYPLVE